MKKEYITNLIPGYSYKTKHYKKWLIYLGKYRTYKPEIGFKEYYAFLKNRKGPSQFILYNNLKKKFHLSGSQILKDVGPSLEKLRSLYPEFNDSSITVVNFEPIGAKEISLLDLISRYERWNERLDKYRSEISFNVHIFDGIFFKEDNNWSCLVYPNFYYKRIFNPYKTYDTKKLIKNDLKYYHLYFHNFHKLFINENGAIKILPQGTERYRLIPIDRPSYYHKVNRIKIKFSNGQEWIFRFTYHHNYYFHGLSNYNYEYNPICGLLKINEV